MLYIVKNPSINLDNVHFYLLIDSDRVQPGRRKESLRAALAVNPIPFRLTTVKVTPLNGALTEAEDKLIQRWYDSGGKECE